MNPGETSRPDFEVVKNSPVVRYDKSLFENEEVFKRMFKTVVWKELNEFRKETSNNFKKVDDQFKKVDDQFKKVDDFNLRRLMINLMNSGRKPVIFIKMDGRFESEKKWKYRLV